MRKRIEEALVIRDDKINNIFYIDATVKGKSIKSAVRYGKRNTKAEVLSKMELKKREKVD